MAVLSTPEGYHSVTPYLIVKGAAAAIDFYKKSFGASEMMRLGGPDGAIAHAEIKIGDSFVMLADENPQMGFRSPKNLGGTPVSMMIYAPNVDAMFAQAVANGAVVMRPIQDQFYGDRSGSLTDPFGHVWTIATHTEDVPPEEMKRRMEEFTKQMQA